MEGQEQDTRSPADFLNAVMGQPVLVKLNSGINYRGSKESTGAMTTHI